MDVYHLCRQSQSDDISERWAGDPVPESCVIWVERGDTEPQYHQKVKNLGYILRKAVCWVENRWDVSVAHVGLKVEDGLKVDHDVSS